MPSLTDTEITVRLLAAALLGAVLGFERELRHKSAGLRTNILIAVGSAVFTLMSYEFASESGGDAGRVAAQIVTGIGFLGAGVIFRQGLSVRGLTTAASLWSVAAIGMAAGAGFWSGAVVGTGATVVSLRALEWAKERVLPRDRPELLVELRHDASAASVFGALETLGVVVQSLRHEGDALHLRLRLGERSRTDATAALADLADVRGLRWER